jgi:hypothetical protein
MSSPTDVPETLFAKHWEDGLPIVAPSQSFPDPGDGKSVH